MSSVVVASFSALAPSSATKVVIDGRPLAVVRIQDDVYVIDDTCSHAEVSLSEGSVWADECEIECWKHGATFSLVSGEPQSLPATKAVRVYSVTVIGDNVTIDFTIDFTSDDPGLPETADNANSANTANTVNTVNTADSAKADA